MFGRERIHIQTLAELLKNVRTDLYDIRDVSQSITFSDVATPD